MTTGSRFVLPFQTVINAIGVPWPGAYLYFFASGTNTPLATYSDEGLTTPNPNPIQADSGGMFSNIFLQPHDYKVRLTDVNMDEIWTADPVSPFVDINVPNAAYDMPVYMGVKPDDNMIFPRFNIVRDCFLPANLTGGAFTIETTSLPTSTFPINLFQKTAGNIGSITFSTSGVPTIVFPAKRIFTPGDQFWPQFPTPQDATAKDITLTFPFTLGT